MKNTVRTALQNRLLVASLSLVGCFTVGLASAQEPIRVIVTGKLPPKEETLSEKDPNAPPEWRGRQPMAQDASGTPRSPGEPRFLTGSLVKQRFDVYGGATTSALNLRVASRTDASHGGFLPGGSGAVGVSGASAAEMSERPKQERFVLDLRRVPAERRLAVATQLLGPERGQRLVDEFNAWLANKNRRAARVN